MSEIIELATEILKWIPLCDRCLGRIFSTYGRNMSNKIRGLAIKTLLTMNIENIVNKFDDEELKRFALNIKFKPFILTLKELKSISIDLNEEPKCFICEDVLEHVIDYFSKQILKETINYEFNTFLIGVHAPKNILKKEEELTAKFKIESYESIKNEIKREIGKLVRDKVNKTPEFMDPDVVFEINLASNSLIVHAKPIFICGKYVKTARRISQVKWLIWKNGKQIRKYRISVEDSIKPLAEIFKAEDAILHAAGREDVDVRMLGKGRPMIVEIRKPKLRKITANRLREAEERIEKASEELIKVFLEGKTVRENVRKIKEESKKHIKIYRALIVSESKIEKDKLAKLEEFFRNKIISQRTPLRVLRRRPDILREKTVYSVKTYYVDDNLFEALIKCDGGLYVKELISGDSGRTQPSFSSALGLNLKCIELDVLHVSLTWGLT